jgi:hypothetical protein
MTQTANCVLCDAPYPLRRKTELNINVCLDCGDVSAEQQRQSWCVVPLPKQAYTLVTSKSDLLHLNQKSR